MPDLSQRVNKLARVAISLLLLWAILLTGDTLVQESANIHTLRFGAQARGFFVGAAVAVRALKDDTTYAQTLGKEFNIVVPENAMKFGSLHPSRDKFTFDEADAIVDFAIAHGMQVRGHTLVWYEQNPEWLVKGNFSSNELAEILKEHIHTVVGHYRGRIYAWDVVNEAIGDNLKQRETLWLRALGPDYMRQAFIWAHEADPQAKLFYNDYGGEALGPKSDAIYSLVRNLKMQGVPIDGIGLQSHFSVDEPLNFKNVIANLKRLAALGLEIHVTEFDVRLPLPPTDESLQQQSNIYRRYLNACLSVKNCKAFLMWGFTDKYSWIPGYFHGAGAALPFDKDYRPKLAYSGLYNALYSGSQ